MCAVQARRSRRHTSHARETCEKSGGTRPRPGAPATSPHRRIRLSRDALGGAVDTAVEEVEDDSLARAALADLQGLAKQVGELLQEQDPGGKDADPGGVELEAAADVSRRVAGEDADAALQRLVLEHGADEAAQRSGGAA